MSESREKETSGLPNGDKPVTEATCESIFWTLIELASTDVGDGRVYVREFAQTARCDHFHDFKSARGDVERLVGGKAAYERVLAYHAADEDARRATAVARLVRRRHRRELVKALSLQNRMYYHTVFLGERALASLRSACNSA